jgi:hypothetical protein
VTSYPKNLFISDEEGQGRASALLRARAPRLSEAQDAPQARHSP